MLLMLHQHTDNAGLWNKGFYTLCNRAIACCLQRFCGKTRAVVIVYPLYSILYGERTKCSCIDRKVSTLGMSA